METIWHYLINQFIVSTVGNFKKALKLSLYHHAFLNKMQTEDPGEPDWATLFARYDPFHQTYLLAYTTWKSSGGMQQGQTLTLDQLLKVLIRRVDTWESQVKATPGFEQGSGPHEALFPLGRKPFTQGGKDARINAVLALATTMANYPALATILGTVNAFHSQLATARSTQSGSIGATKTMSLNVEARRIEVMTEQFRDLGFLINKLAPIPEHIAPFFDLNVLRDSTQVIFTGTLDPNETEAILIHTFSFDDEMQLEIKGLPETPEGTMVQFYLATTPGGTDSTAVAVEANALHITIPLTAFGISDYGIHRHLTAVNANGIELHYVVELL